ncbi:Oxysterol-binding protein [Phytophthora infestans]|uniref:Oxysterol-binding protein n=1 Tax=Phytophthora infestans TaxID=4787 RepID=A0A8S9V5H7_PHYIN|nr:Oxysterol-binding protein [Phytophthora infestans]
MIDGIVPYNSGSSIEAQKAAAQSVVKSNDTPTNGNPQLRPTLCAQDSWAQLQIKDQMPWMEHFKQNKRGGLVFRDQETLKKQQVRISLPIRIFEPRPLLERVANECNSAPTVIKDAALSGSDPNERMKFVMTFVSGGQHFCVSQLKPFNPILEETYEATYPDVTQVFMEHLLQPAANFVGEITAQL